MSAAVHHPIFGRLYARLSPRADAKGVAEHRREALEGLTGRVIELGAGNGLSFAYYPETVPEVVAVEPEDYLRERAEEAARSAPVPVRVVDAVADDLPVPDETFDAAVASLVLCSVPDQATALGELRRVLRRGGELRFYEHVRPTTRGPRVSGSAPMSLASTRGSRAAATPRATPSPRSAPLASMSSAAGASPSRAARSPRRTSSASHGVGDDRGPPGTTPARRRRVIVPYLSAAAGRPRSDALVPRRAYGPHVSA